MYSRVLNRYACELRSENIVAYESTIQKAQRDPDRTLWRMTTVLCAESASKQLTLRVITLRSARCGEKLSSSSSSVRRWERQAEPFSTMRQKCDDVANNETRKSVICLYVKSRDNSIILHHSFSVQISAGGVVRSVY